MAECFCQTWHKNTPPPLRILVQRRWHGSDKMTFSLLLPPKETTSPRNNDRGKKGGPGRQLEKANWFETLDFEEYPRGRMSSTHKRQLNTNRQFFESHKLLKLSQMKQVILIVLQSLKKFIKIFGKINCLDQGVLSKNSTKHLQYN